MNPEELQARLEELKEELLAHDRAVAQRGWSAKPTAEEKRARSRIVREINRVRREQHRLATGRGPARKVALTFTPAEHERLSAQAEAEGLPLIHFLKAKLLDQL